MIYQYFSSDGWLIKLFIGLLICYLVNYWMKVLSYPRGPFPLPILGNILSFRGQYNDPSPLFGKFKEWSEKFGPIFTIWAGSIPFVVVNNYELNTEASITKRNDFIDRPDSVMNRILQSGAANIFSSSGPVWEALKGVGIGAVRKYAVSEKVPTVINEVMDDTVELIKKEGQNPFNPIVYIDYLIYNILAYTAYGEKFKSINDKNYLDAKKINDELYELAGNGLLSEYISWLRPLFYRREVRLLEITKVSVEITKKHFIEHKKSFSPGVFRDFTDCVLEAKEEALKEDNSRTKYLTDDNLMMIVSDLFQAGCDTSQTLLRWTILILANDKQIQDKIHKEIVDNLGDRNPTQDDKDILPFTYAFVLEVLRFRPSAPVGIDHSNSEDSQIGGHKIPKGTRIIFNLYEQNNDPKYWENPNEVNPNRFLDHNGNLLKEKFASFATFGMGRRGCPGEKLALNNFFLIVTRFVQSFSLKLSTGFGTADLIPINIILGLFPKDYKIICYARK